jgi:glycosyltransferase involved in cell wall biosynthesis
MSVSVVLNGYKRGKFLKEQIEAIKNQTIKPKEILLWQNYGESFDKKVTESTIHANCNHNFGVWARFAYALNCRSKYICVFDDDTIPGSKWLENCLNTIQTHEGLLGTVGVVFKSDSGYHPCERFGWTDNNNVEVKQVDIVGHSWFFKREWLSTFWRELPDLNQSNLVGEDMHFSYTLQKYLGLNTYVPPHPIDDKEMWGSTFEKGWSIGTDKNAISQSPLNMMLMSSTYTDYIKKGFKRISNG